MRIALIAPGFSARPGDWSIPALLDLARALAQNHEIHVFSQRYPDRGTYQFDNLTHHALGGGQNFGLASVKIWLQTSRAITGQHQETPFDLLHAFWLDEAGFSAAVAGAQIRRPVVVSLGGGELTKLPNINYGAQRFLARRLTTRYALKNAALVTAGSNYQLDACRLHQVPEYKLRLAPLGVDTNRFRPPGGENKAGRTGLSPPLWGPGKPPVIIQVASLLPVKNQVLLLEVLNLVKEEIPGLKLNLTGSGPLQTELVSLAQKLNLSHNICWHQQVPYLEMPGLYQQSHLYLQTSHHESQGMAVLEAMACGLPVLGTPVGVMRDVACLPPQTSKEALAAQVSQIFSDETRHLASRREARRVVENEYSLSVAMNNFLKIYEACIL